MSNFVKYDDVLKFANTFDQSDLDDKLEALGVQNISEATEHFSKYASDDVTPVIVDNKDYVSLFYAQKANYLDSSDNPLAGNPDYVKFTQFHSANQRDSYLNNLNPKNYYLVEKYEHSAVHFSLSQTGNYPDRRWDVTPDCAVLEIGKELKALRKALKTKHGEDDGEMKFSEHLNKMLEQYSSYCNGYASEVVEVVVPKETGEIDVQSSGVCFDDKNLKQDMAYLVFNAISQERVDEIKLEIREVGSTENLKGFDNNIMRKGAELIEVFKHSNDEGLESKMAIVYFPEKVAIYVKSHDNLYEHLQAKSEEFAVGNQQQFRKNNAIRQFARNIAISELVENAMRYEVEKEPSALKMK